MFYLSSAQCGDFTMTENSSQYGSPVSTSSTPNSSPNYITISDEEIVDQGTNSEKFTLEDCKLETVKMDTSESEHNSVGSIGQLSMPSPELWDIFMSWYNMTDKESLCHMTTPYPNKAAKSPKTVVPSADHTSRNPARSETSEENQADIGPVLLIEHVQSLSDSTKPALESGKRQPEMSISSNSSASTIIGLPDNGNTGTKSTVLSQTSCSSDGSNGSLMIDSGTIIVTRTSTPVSTRVSSNQQFGQSSSVKRKRTMENTSGSGKGSSDDVRPTSVSAVSSRQHSDTFSSLHSCTKCWRILKTANYLKRHQEVCCKRYGCAKCNSFFSFKDELTLHSCTFHSDGKKIFVPDAKFSARHHLCEICGRCNFSSICAKQHASQHNKYTRFSILKEYTCVSCHSYYVKLTHAEYHVNTCHSRGSRGLITFTTDSSHETTKEDKPSKPKTTPMSKYSSCAKNSGYRCDDCGKAFMKHSSLVGHMKVHNPQQNKNESCVTPNTALRHCADTSSSCRKCHLYYDGLSLNEKVEHLKQCHGDQRLCNNKRRRCEYCGDKYMCQQCKTRFSYKEDLYEHISTNTDKKTCQRICTEDFGNVGNFQPCSNVCETCGRCFKSWNVLAKHQEDHEPFTRGIGTSRTYYCLPCETYFDQHDELVRHWQEFHTPVYVKSMKLMDKPQQLSDMSDSADKPAPRSLNNAWQAVIKQGEVVSSEEGKTRCPQKLTNHHTSVTDSSGKVVNVDAIPIKDMCVTTAADGKPKQLIDLTSEDSSQHKEKPEAGQENNKETHLPAAVPDEGCKDYGKTSVPNSSSNMPDPSSKMYKCGQCKQQFHMKSVWLNHQRLHAISSNRPSGGRKVYECNVCKAQYTSKSAYELHKLIHYSEKEKQLPTVTAVKSSTISSSVTKQNQCQSVNVKTPDDIVPPCGFRKSISSTSCKDTVLRRDSPSQRDEVQQNRGVAQKSTPSVKPGTTTTPSMCSISEYQHIRIVNRPELTQCKNEAKTTSNDRHFNNKPITTGPDTKLSSVVDSSPVILSIICRVCGDNLPFRSRLSDHPTFHDIFHEGSKAQIEYECEMCHITFFDYHIFCEHMEVIHSRNIRKDTE